MTYRTHRGQSSAPGAGGPGGSMDNGIGFFNYQNTLAPQVVNAEAWTTLLNNGAGTFTELRYAPAGVDTMLDPATGRILLDDLAAGDQIYVRHTLDIVPYTNGLSVLFRNLVGQAGQQYSVPTGPYVSLNSGAGIPSGLFTVDTHFYIRDENTRLGGVLPQIQPDGTCEVTYAGVFISVMRRTK